MFLGDSRQRLVRFIRVAARQPKNMTLVPNIVAVFEQAATPLLRCEVFKSDGDLSDANRPDNRYVRNSSEFKLIAAVWDKKFLRFE
jgi:hypothetical protein